MSIFNFLRGNTSQEFQFLENITNVISDTSKGLTGRQSVGRQLGDLFIEKSEQLIADLVMHPEHASTYQLLSQRLKNIDEGLSQSFEFTLDSIQNIAKFLRDGNDQGLDRLTNQMSTQLIDSPFFLTTTSSFHTLHLPQDIDKVRKIPNPEVLFRVMAQLINRDKIPISTLVNVLTKEEIKSLAPHLTFLDCGNAFSNWGSTELHHFIRQCSKNLKTLIVHSDALTRLPPLPNCEELDIADCPNLNRPPVSLPKCQKLYCSNCKFSIPLPELPHCRELVCRNGHVELPIELPQCEMLNCSGNGGIVGRLPLLPNCININCSATLVEEMPPILPKCRTLDCSNCLVLRHMAQLPNCDHLRGWRNCPLLAGDTVPARFKHTRVQPEILQVSVAGLNINPLNVLLDLSSVLIHGYDIPSIQFIEIDGTRTPIDRHSGPIKNLISRLMDGLVFHTDTEGQLSFIKDAFGLTPVLRSNDEGLELEERKKGFQTLGAVFVQCLKHRFVTGHLFNPSLFKMICSLSSRDFAGSPDDPLDLADLPEHLRIKLMLAGAGDEIPFRELLLKKNTFEALTDSEYEMLRDNILLILGEEAQTAQTPNLDKISPENKKWVYEKAMQYCRDVEKDKRETQGDTLLPAFIIARQMYALCSNLRQWHDLSVHGPTTLQNSIEGELTPGLFLNAIQWQLAPNIGEDDAIKIKNFVTNFIMGVTNDQVDPALARERIANLTFAITSSKTLTSQSVLHFHLVNREPNRLPNVHTCFSIIEISANCPDYETFEKNMQILIMQSIAKSHSGFVM